MAHGVMLVLTNPTDAASEAEFNDWYDLHVRELLEVPGVVGATRYQLLDDQPPGADWPVRRYLVVYELDADDLDAVRDSILATSSSRTHSPTLELSPLPITAIYRQIRERVGE